MSLPPQSMRRLIRELTELKKSPPEGIRVQTPEDNMLDVVGIVRGPAGTPYEGGFFRVKFKFTEEFPAAPPKCWFVTKIFHPNVSSSGEICVNTLKKDWSPTYGISHILVTIKCLLIYPNPESALDEEAGKLLLEDYERYCERARLITSIHATPKVKPVEFDDDDKEPAVDAKSTATTSIPTTSTTSTTPTTTVTHTASTSKLSLPPTPYPLKSSPPNTHPEITTALSKDRHGATPSSMSANNKERHVSPSPLGTADANVTGGGATAGPGTRRNINNGEAGGAPMSMSKAVKRSATGAAVTGAEKRKKALKRL